MLRQTMGSSGPVNSSRMVNSVDFSGLRRAAV